MNFQYSTPRQRSGFTLIEIAIALFIIAIITTAGVKLLTAQAESVAYSAVAKKQEAIEQALITYLGKFKRLPCPDAKAMPDGVESRSMAAPAECLTYFGRVPYTTLGLSRDTALDSWESYMSYAVSPGWTLTLTAAPAVAGVPQTPDPAVAFSVGSVGGLTVNDRIPATSVVLTAVASNPAAGTGAAVVVISHGRNALGAFTIRGTQIALPAAATDEAENIDGTNTLYVKRDFTDTDVPTYGGFDDVVLVVKPDELIGPLSRDGSLKPSVASVTDQLATIRDSAIGRVAATCTVPTLAELVLAPLATVDAWGEPIQYVAAAAPLSAGTPQPPGAVAIKVWSRGPNMADDAEAGTAAYCLTTVDNFCLTVTYDVLRARVPLPYCP